MSTDNVVASAAARTNDKKEERSLQSMLAYIAVDCENLGSDPRTGEIAVLSGCAHRALAVQGSGSLRTLLSVVRVAGPSHRILAAD